MKGNRGLVLVLLIVGALWGAFWGSLIVRLDYYRLVGRGTVLSHYVNSHVIRSVVRRLLTTTSGRYTIVWGFTLGSALTFAYFGARWIDRDKAPPQA